MSNLAKSWQKGDYILRVEGNSVEAIKVYSERINGHVYCNRKVAVARCDPKDEFSLSVGVALAMDRLNKELGKNEIEVGDKVKIVDSGKVYTTNINWIEKNIKDVRLAACFVYGQLPKADGIEYIVKAVAPWDVEHRRGKMLAYVQEYFAHENGEACDDGACYLIGIDGLETV